MSSNREQQAEGIPELGLHSSGIAEVISSQIDALGENENKRLDSGSEARNAPFAARGLSEVELADRSAF